MSNWNLIRRILPYHLKYWMCKKDRIEGIFKTVTGTFLNLKDSLEYKIEDFRMQGQDGIGTKDEESGKWKYEILIHGKNFIKELYTGLLMNAEGRIEEKGYEKYKTIYMYLPAGSYVINADVDINVVRECIDGNYKTIGGTYGKGKGYFVTIPTTGMFGFSFRRTDGQNFTGEENVQLELGDIVTEYEEYKEQKATILLENPINSLDYIEERASIYGVAYNSKGIWKPLTEKEQEELKRLKTYEGTTIIINNNNLNMEVTYAAKPINFYNY